MSYEQLCAASQSREELACEPAPFHLGYLAVRSEADAHLLVSPITRMTTVHGAWCAALAVARGVIASPGGARSWGSLGEAERARWQRARCDDALCETASVVANQTGECDPTALHAGARAAHVVAAVTATSDAHPSSEDIFCTTAATTYAAVPRLRFGALAIAEQVKWVKARCEDVLCAANGTSTWACAPTPLLARVLSTVPWSIALLQREHACAAGTRTARNWHACLPAPFAQLGDVPAGWRHYLDAVYGTETLTFPLALRDTSRFAFFYLACLGAAVRDDLVPTLPVGMCQPTCVWSNSRCDDKCWVPLRYGDTYTQWGGAATLNEGITTAWIFAFMSSDAGNGRQLRSPLATGFPSHTQIEVYHCLGGPCTR